MIKLISGKFSVEIFKNQLNALKQFSPYQFKIVDEIYIDIDLKSDASIEQQICGVILILQIKLPILLEQQQKHEFLNCASFQLRFDIDQVTKNKEIKYPINVIEKEKLIYDPMFCDQSVYFQKLEQDVQKEQNIQIYVNAEQFGLVLLLFKLRNLLNRKYESQKISFEIMIYPSALNFAIIKKDGNGEFLYFCDEKHRDWFFKQNSKQHHINLLDKMRHLELTQGNDAKQNFYQVQNIKNKENMQTTFFNYHNKQIVFQLFQIYNNLAEIIPKAIVITQRNDYEFRRKINYINDDEEAFQVVQNDFYLGFSGICNNDANFNHQVQLKDNQPLICACGFEITKENFDKLIIDVKLINLVKQIQFELLKRRNLDSCVFKISLDIHLKQDQSKNQYAAISIKDQVLFDIPYNVRVNDTQALSNEIMWNRNIFEMANYTSEEDWDEEQCSSVQSSDANKTQPGK